MLIKTSRLVAVLATLLLLGGCKDIIQCTDSNTLSHRYPVGDWLVDINPDHGSWEVRRHAADAPLLSSTVCEGDVLQPPVQIASGKPVVPTFTGSFLNIPKQLDKLTWKTISGLEPVIEQDDMLSITWPAGDDMHVTLGFKLHDNGNLWVGILDQGDAFSTAGINMDCRADEAFFGLGTQSTGLDLRGRRYPLWTQEQGLGKTDINLAWPLTNRREAAYAPMGVWHSSAGYSAVIGHDSYSDIDLCTDENTLSLRSHKLPPSFVLVKGDTVKQRLTAITDYVGRMPNLPPDWVFGPWNNAAGGDEWLLETVRQLRENDIPSSAMWSEDWAGAKDDPLILKLSFNWQWDPNRYRDLPRTIGELHQQGFAFLAYFNPFVSRAGDNWQYGDDNGLFIQNSKGKTYTFIDYFFARSTLLDLTNPDTLSWFKTDQMYAANELGIDGWMADFAEWLPINAQLHSGEDAWIAHNQYPLQWQQANRDALADTHQDNNWTFFVRSGWASINGGTPGIAPVLWAGDQNTDWSKSDGMPSVIPIGAHAGMAGVPLFAIDVGGYFSLPPLITHTDKELFFRWVSLGAFQPVMRTHHGTKPCGNWMFSSDNETLAHYKRYAQIHTVLLPFFKERALEAKQFGWPILRHPFLASETDQGVWRNNDYVYFLGDDVFVAPVISRHSDAREVQLPQGDWWPLFGEQPVAAVDRADGAFAAATTEIPVFVRGGAIIPLLPQAVDSFHPIDAGHGQGLAHVQGHYRLALYPDQLGVLKTSKVDGASISGSFWSGMTGQDWSQATWQGNPLSRCEESPSTHCYLDDGLYLQDVTSGEVRLGEAQLTITGTTPTSWTIQLGGDAWGNLAIPTTYTPSRDRYDNCTQFVPY